MVLSFSSPSFESVAFALFVTLHFKFYATIHRGQSSFLSFFPSISLSPYSVYWMLPSAAKSYRTTSFHTKLDNILTCLFSQYFLFAPPLSYRHRNLYLLTISRGCPNTDCSHLDRMRAFDIHPSGRCNIQQLSPLLTCRVKISQKDVEGVWCHYRNQVPDPLLPK